MKRLVLLLLTATLCLGLDTFCEIWDTDRPDASPYGHPGLNSYCHLWASTPLYFWGRYPAIFAGIR